MTTIHSRIAFLVVSLISGACSAAAQYAVRVVSNCDAIPATVYIGLDNYLQVDGLTEGTKVYVNGKQIVKQPTGEFVYSPKAGLSGSDTLSIWRGGRIVEKFPLIRQHFCEAQAEVKNVANGTVTVDGLLSFPKIQVSFPGCCVNSAISKVV